MDIESNESSVTKENECNLRAEEAASIDDAETPKIFLETTIPSREEIDDDRQNQKPEMPGDAKNDSFKKPTPLIGPRRGKPGQSRPTIASSSKEIGERREEASFAQEDNAECGEKMCTSDKRQIPLSYKEPSWGGSPEAEYSVEVLKSGVILEIIDISDKSFYTVGRLPNCDVSLAHPTISRYHAILQYRSCEEDKNPKGFYLYDLGSTHGTFWNGCRIRPNTYARLQGGHMIRFGCSQRKFIVQTPPDDVENESELSVTELKEKRRLLLLEREEAAKEEETRAAEAEKLRPKKEEEEGIDWGMGEDADEETDLAENPYASTNNEELFLDDPKKTLRGWFEREGLELQYETEEKGIGQFLCWVNLPIDGEGGRTVRAEALVKGKKKESVVQCALEACRILDRHGVLRQATHEARKRKARNWEEEDYYDSDEDNYLDRTGTVEKKREQRMRQAGKLEEKIETYASLLEKHGIVAKKIANIESQLKRSKKSKEKEAEASNEDALDAFMSSLGSTVCNKADVRKMKLDLVNLRKEEEKLVKLVNITRPANLPPLTSQRSVNEPGNTADKKVRDDVAKKRIFDRENETEKSSLREKNSKRTNDDANFTTNESIDVKIPDKTKKDDPIEERMKLVESSTGDVEIDEREVSDVQRSNDDENEKNAAAGVARKKMRNIKRMQQRAEKSSKETKMEYDDEAYSEDYSMWLPPQNQSGDGKTTLNDKYGY